MAAKSTKTTAPAPITEAVTEDKVEAVTQELVEVNIPRAYANEDPNLLVSVNGVNYLLPRGKKSKVPWHIAYEINRALAAEEAADERGRALESNQ